MTSDGWNEMKLLLAAQHCKINANNPELNLNTNYSVSWGVEYVSCTSAEG